MTRNRTAPSGGAGAHGTGCGFPPPIASASLSKSRCTLPYPLSSRAGWMRKIRRLPFLRLARKYSQRPALQAPQFPVAADIAGSDSNPKLSKRARSCLASSSPRARSLSFPPDRVVLARTDIVPEPSFLTRITTFRPANLQWSTTKNARTSRSLPPSSSSFSAASSAGNWSPASASPSIPHVVGASGQANCWPEIGIVPRWREKYSARVAGVSTAAR